MDRYHVVVVSKYLGNYGKGSPIAYAIADHEQANRCVSQKYDTESEAQANCDRLNNGTAVTIMKTLPKRHAGSPLKTNACINREAAVKCFKAGMTIEQIVKEWPEVFKISIEQGIPKLGMRYDYELADGSGRYETNRLITSVSVTAAIRKYRENMTREK